MNEEQKNKINAAAKKAAAAAADKARAADGWKKWLWFAAAIIAAGVALVTTPGCAARFDQTANRTAAAIIILPSDK